METRERAPAGASEGQSGKYAEQSAHLPPSPCLAVEGNPNPRPEPIQYTVEASDPEPRGFLRKKKVYFKFFYRNK